MIIRNKSTAVRVLLARHIPDLRRMEPHNIGVIVWSPHGIFAKFLEHDKSGKRGSRTAAFSDWVEYWEGLIARDRARNDAGKIIESTDPAFVELLKSKSKAQYSLIEAGVLLDSIAPTEIPDVVDEMYRELVAPPEKTPKAQLHHLARELEHFAKQAIGSSDLCNASGFRARYDWICSNKQGQKEYFHFDYAIHNNGPQLIMQKVPWKIDRVYSTAYQFQAMSSTYKQLKHERCISLVFASPAELEDDRIHSSWRVLESNGSIINVHDTEKAIAQLNGLAS